MLYDVEKHRLLILSHCLSSLRDLTKFMKIVMSTSQGEVYSWLETVFTVKSSGRGINRAEKQFASAYHLALEARCACGSRQGAMAEYKAV